MTLAAMNALDFGFQAFEKVWELRGREATLKKMKDVDPAQVEILSDEVGDFAGFKLKSSEFRVQSSGTEDGIVVPAEKAFVFTYGKEFGDLYGRSRLAPVAETWWWGVELYKQTNQYFERRANPPIKARAPKGQRPDASGVVRDNMELAESLAQALKSGGVATFPAEYDEHGNMAWDFQYLLDDKRADMFLAYIEHLDVKKLRGLLVPERALTQDGGSGSYAMARTHADAFMQMEQALIDEYLDHLNRYVVPQMVLYNLGPRAPVPMIRSKGLGEENTEALQRVLEQLFQSEDGGREVRERVDVGKLLEGLGVPVTEQRLEVRG
jgi:hypothetical protein